MENKMNYKKVVFGLLVMLLGVLLMLKNFKILNSFWQDVLFSWQMLVIALGFIVIFGREKIIGAFVMMVGGFFMVDKFVDFTFNFHAVIWPLLIMFAGVLIISGSRKTKCCSSLKQGVCDDYVDEVSVFGGVEKKISCANFKGGKITSIFGGGTYDFTNSQLADNVNELEVVMIFGGVKLIFPETWNVKTDNVSILGGFADKRFATEEKINKNKTLIIKGVAIFGGGEISN